MLCKSLWSLRRLISGLCRPAALRKGDKVPGCIAGSQGWLSRPSHSRLSKTIALLWFPVGESQVTNKEHEHTGSDTHRNTVQVAAELLTRHVNSKIVQQKQQQQHHQQQQNDDKNYNKTTADVQPSAVSLNYCFFFY